MNNSALKLFHELMKKGWIDRNDNSLMWNLVEDNEARDELDQMGIELGFEIIQAQDRIYMVPTQDNDLFLKNNVDYRADIKARETVPVKVYKIDLNVANSSYKRWEDTLTQSSGAEKFVVFFSVVLTLMNYTRSTSGIVSKEAKSVLILDNPFGKITSAHLLKPMFDIAKHFNVQLICLSDINKSDVTSCFECVIKLVIKQQALSTFEIMTHEDNERIEHGYYKIMNGQMSLF